MPKIDLMNHDKIGSDTKSNKSAQELREQNEASTSLKVMSKLSSRSASVNEKADSNKIVVSVPTRSNASAS